MEKVSGTITGTDQNLMQSTSLLIRGFAGENIVDEETDRFPIHLPADAAADAATTACPYSIGTVGIWACGCRSVSRMPIFHWDSRSDLL